MKIKALLAFIVSSFAFVDLSQAAQTFASTGIFYTTPALLQIVGPNGDQSQYVSVPPLSVSTNLYIDPDTLTGRFSGSFSSTTANISYTTAEYTQQVGFTAPSFPNPPQPLFASGTASISVTIDVSQSNFDSGIKPIFWNGTTYSLGYQVIGSLQGTLSMTMSVTSNGQTTTETRTHNFSTSVWMSGPLNLSDYPNSASIQWGNDNWSAMTSMTVSAPNNFTTTFQIVPEPSSALLLGASALGLLIRRRRSRR